MQYYATLKFGKTGSRGWQPIKVGSRIWEGDAVFDKTGWWKIYKVVGKPIVPKSDDAVFMRPLPHG